MLKFLVDIIESGFFLLPRGPFRLVGQIWKESGIRGFYHGLVSTFAREMPGYFFFFGAYEFSRSLLTPKNKTKNDLGPIQTAVCGGIGGVSFCKSFLFAL